MHQAVKLALVTTLTTSAGLSQSRAEWKSPSPIAGTDWAYTEDMVGGKATECQIFAQTLSTNKASKSKIRISILYNGTILISIEDSDWKNRISMDFGWNQNRQFEDVQLLSADSRASASGFIISDIFSIKPNESDKFAKSNFFDSQEFSVVVGGIDFKSFSVPKIREAWSVLQRCSLFRKPIRYDGLVNETSADRKRLEDSLFMHGTPTEDALAAFSRQDYASAWRNLQPLEDQRDARAQTIIGLMYQAGLGTTKNPEEAAKWFHRAAAQGEVFSEAVLGRLYYFGQGVAKSYIQSVRWFRMAAEAGDAESQYNVGTFYERGFFEQGVDFRIDNREAVKWYRLAARQGHPGALNNLGTFYADGKVLPQDYVRAHAYFNLAAASGEPENAMKSKKNRDKIAARMTKTQLARAQEMASRCEQSHYQNCD